MVTDFDRLFHDLFRMLHLRDGMVGVQVSLSPLECLGFVESCLVHALLQSTLRHIQIVLKLIHILVIIDEGVDPHRLVFVKRFYLERIVQAERSDMV